jgi:hypothetical protein
MSEHQRIKMSYEQAKAFPLGTIARDTNVYWNGVRRAFVKTGELFWASLDGEISRSQIEEVIARKQNNLSPYPTDWVEISYGLADPEVETTSKESTPDTEHVRAQYSRMENFDEYYEGDWYQTPDGQRSAELFNLWLAEVKEEAFKAGYVSAGIAALIQVLELAKVRVEEGSDDE